MKQRKDSPVLREMLRVQRDASKFAQPRRTTGRADLRCRPKRSSPGSNGWRTRRMSRSAGAVAKPKWLRLAFAHWSVREPDRGPSGSRILPDRASSDRVDRHAGSRPE